jgi:hypothetical protein
MAKVVFWGVMSLPMAAMIYFAIQIYARLAGLLVALPK